MRDLGKNCSGLSTMVKQLPPFDIDAYLSRIDLEKDILTSHPPPSYELLRLICQHHAQAIPFENLTPSKVFPVDPAHVNGPGEVVSLTPANLFQKLVVDRRGGYCFESNGLLSIALRALGYTVELIGGRVVVANTDENKVDYDLQPLTHTLLLVESEDNKTYLCDVGFGGRGQPPCPLSFTPGEGVDLPTGERYELANVTMNRNWTLSTFGGLFTVAKDTQVVGGNQWAVLYRTGIDKPLHPAYVFSTSTFMAQKDYDVANWYCSTSPVSHMTQRPIVAKRYKNQLLTLAGNAFTVLEAGQVIESKTIEQDELLTLLQDRFDLVSSPFVNIMCDAYQLDLRAYFNRIGISEALVNKHERGSLELLTLICQHHTWSIPFENLAPCRIYPAIPAHANTAIGEVVSLDIAKIFQKLVIDRRGGYCFEQNGLLAVVLRALGYTLSTLSARVVMANTDENRSDLDMSGLSHALLLVNVKELQYLCDVGFGGRGQPPCPMLLSTTNSRVELATGQCYELRWTTKIHLNQPQAFSGKYVMPKNTYDTGNQPNGDSWALCYSTGKNKPMYPAYIFSSSHVSVQADYEIANWFCSSSPHTFFTKSPLIVRRTETSLWTLVDTELSHFENGELVETKSVCKEEFQSILQTIFGLFPNAS
ncbi:N-acetyltransferase [Thraustotheca clavata]|uniref:N-acetyltransferase n=1 Tax=Thraustotheca clavata TaxID=74557 RepID=A0A1V9ZPT2_9STRA|nr:N-acetyltransferase [Thraustotheca clavata]